MKNVISETSVMQELINNGTPVRTFSQEQRWKAKIHQFKEFVFNISHYFKEYSVEYDVSSVFTSNDCCTFTGTLKGYKFNITKLMHIAPDNCKFTVWVDKSGKNNTAWPRVTIVMYDWKYWED